MLSYYSDSVFKCHFALIKTQEFAGGQVQHNELDGGRRQCVIFKFLIKNSVLMERTEPNQIILVRFRFGPNANFGSVQSEKNYKFGFRFFRFGSVLDRTDRMLSPSSNAVRASLIVSQVILQI